MTRLQWVLFFILPGLKTAAQLLRTKDENSTGVDDEAAEAIEYALTRLDRFNTAQFLKGEPNGVQ